MRIDAHQHFWSLARGDYGWLTPDLEPIFRDFLPDDLVPHLTAAGIEGTILVQAAPTVAETEFMLSLAQDHTFIKGVVGWVNFEAPDAPIQIAQLSENPVLVGLRPMIQDIDDPNWMLRTKLTPAFEAVQKLDLIFDALTLPVHLRQLRHLLDRYPEMRVVIDHGSKPAIRDDAFQDWAKDIKALASETSAFCKLSGLVTEASPGWNTDDLRPYVQHLLDCFGPDRLIWGSDWPVCTLASGYARWVETTNELLNELTVSQIEAVYGGTAGRAYNLRE